MEVVRHHALAAVLHRLVVEGAEAGAVQFGEHRHLVIGHMAQVESVAHLAHLVGGVAAEEERIVRHVEEVLAVVVDDVDALIGGLRECLRRFHVRLRPLVVGISDALHAVLVHKEIVYLCHILITLIAMCLQLESSPQRFVLPPTVLSKEDKDKH